jgi:hypothetical protein
MFVLMPGNDTDTIFTQTVSQKWGLFITCCSRALVGWCLLGHNLLAASSSPADKHKAEPLHAMAEVGSMYMSKAG